MIQATLLHYFSAINLEQQRWQFSLQVSLYFLV